MKKQARVLRPVPIRQWVLSMSVLSGSWADPAAGGREENGSCSA